MLIIFSIKKQYFVYLFFYLFTCKVSGYIDAFDKCFNFIITLSNSLLIIIYFYEEYSSKLNNKQYTEKLVFKSPEEVNLEKKKQKNENLKLTILILSLILMNIITNYIFEYSKDLFELDINILILFFINYLCFERNIYSHQLVSIFMDIITLILSLFFKQKIGVLKIILFIIGSYTYCFSFVLIKYINTIYFINIYLLGSLQGMIGFVLYIITQIINENKIIDLNLIPYYIYIVSIIIGFSYHYINYKIIFELNPLYFYIFENILFFIMDIQLNIESIGYIIIIISSLIYLEIIELNFCNLNYNIKKKIMERALYNEEKSIYKSSYYSEMQKQNLINLII